LVILSDHGQTSGATFLQRYGKSLEEFVQELMTAEYRVETPIDSGEGYGAVNAFLTDTITNEASGATKVVGRVFKGKTLDGEVMLGPEGHEIVFKGKTLDGEVMLGPEGHEIREEAREGGQKTEDEEEKPAIYALASGNLGLVSFTQWPQRMTMEEINEVFPAVLPGLTAHEGVGFVMVRSQEHGPVVIGAQGKYFLADDRIEGENPLANFGPRAADHLRRTDSFPNCPDILVNSFYDPETNEGCAFEELIGFHGGMGGMQTQPFILHPAELPTNGEMVGAADVYKLCKGWLNQLHGNS
jgi:hypothetical protein